MAIQYQGWMRTLGQMFGLWNPQKGVQNSGPTSYANDALQSVGDRRALSIAAVFRCIRIIAEVCSSLPIRGFARESNGDRAPLPDSHWLNGILCEPNEEMAGDEWAETQYGQMGGWGNAYSQIVPNDEGRAVELWPYNVSDMKVERRVDRTLQYTYPNVNGYPTLLGKGRVMHLRAFSLDGVMGLSPLAYAREALGMAIAQDRYGASFFAQGGRPAGVLTSDKLLNDKQREQIRKEYGGLAEGSTDKRLWVMEAALKYTPVTVNPEDMQMLQARAFSIAEIARFFGVPLFLLMETEKSTSWGSGIEQQNIAFLTYALRPYLQRMVTTFNRRIIPLAERAKIFVDIDDSPLLLLDSAAQKELYSSLSQNAIMTRNEIRRILKLPRSTEKNADALTLQSAQTTLANLGRVAPPSQPNVTGSL